MSSLSAAHSIDSYLRDVRSTLVVGAILTMVNARIRKGKSPIGLINPTVGHTLFFLC
jgi:hypothetical protein